MCVCVTMYPIYSNVTARPQLGGGAEAVAERTRMMRAPQRREESRERPLHLLRTEAMYEARGQGQRDASRERRRERDEEEEDEEEEGVVSSWEGGGLAAAASRAGGPPMRSTSIRLRRRRDQAKQEFLQNRRSGEFGYHSTDLDWGGGGGEGVVAVARTADPGPQHQMEQPRQPHPQQGFESRSDIADNRRRGGNNRSRRQPASNISGPVEFTNFGLIDSPGQLLAGGEPVSLPVTGQEQKNLTLRKGLLWIQRDRLFSRWKERFVILTQDTLYTFKKAVSSIAEMGQFLMKVIGV